MGIMQDIEYKTLQDIGVKDGNKNAVVVMVDQNSEDWFGVRSGIVTSSQVSVVVTSKGKGSSGDTRRTYINRLIAERLTGSVQVGYRNGWMEQGQEHEPQARRWYEMETGRTVTEVGFVYRDEKRQFGGSPDGLCEDRGIEIKCPARSTMIGYLLSGKVPSVYIPQVQFLMWVTGLPRWDFVVWNDAPEIPNVIWTVEADPKVQAGFAVQVPQVCREIEEGVAKIKEEYGDGE